MKITLKDLSPTIKLAVIWLNVQAVLALFMLALILCGILIAIIG